MCAERVSDGQASHTFNRYTRGHAVALDNEVRGAAGDVRRLVERPHPIAAQCFDKGRQSRTIAVLGGLLGSPNLGYLMAVGSKCVEGHGFFKIPQCALR